MDFIILLAILLPIVIIFWASRLERQTRKLGYILAAFFTLFAVGYINWFGSEGMTDPEKFDPDEIFSRISTASQGEVPMVLVPGGEFLMGSNEGGFNEKPERSIHLDPFYIDPYEVTYARYLQFVREAGHRKPWSEDPFARRGITNFIGPDKPVVFVTWEDANAYCQWRGARLPTEAEWEKASRGLAGRIWPWGNRWVTKGANTRGEEDGVRYTAGGGHFPLDKSPYGIYDMGGNVREWVADWYKEDYYSQAPLRNPMGPPLGEMKVIRGSSWNDSIDLSRTTTRSGMFPDYRDMTIGFRCAKSGGVREGVSTQNRSSQ